jgi:hypothetical protein
MAISYQTRRSILYFGLWGAKAKHAVNIMATTLSGAKRPGTHHTQLYWAIRVKCTFIGDVHAPASHPHVPLTTPRCSPVWPKGSLRQLCRSFRGYSNSQRLVELWIPAHCGVPGKERPDILAKGKEENSPGTRHHLLRCVATYNPLSNRIPQFESGIRFAFNTV